MKNLKLERVTQSINQSINFHTITLTYGCERHVNTLCNVLIEPRHLCLPPLLFLSYNELCYDALTQPRQQRRYIDRAHCEVVKLSGQLAESLLHFHCVTTKQKLLISSSCFVCTALETVIGQTADSGRWFSVAQCSGASRQDW
jgi:hypothetical protein